MTNKMDLFRKAKDKDYVSILKDLYKIKQYEDERPVKLIEKLIEDNPEFIVGCVGYHGYFSRNALNKEELFTTYKGPASFSKSLERCIRFVSLVDNSGVLCRGIIRQTGKFFDLDSFILDCLHNCGDGDLQDEFSVLLGELELFAYIDNYEVLDYEEVLKYVGNYDYVKSIFKFSKGMILDSKELDLMHKILVMLAQDKLPNEVKRSILENFRRRTRFWEIRKVYANNELSGNDVVTLTLEKLRDSKVIFKGEVFLVSKSMQVIKEANVYPQLKNILDELTKGNMCWALAEDMKYFGYVHII